MRKNNKLGFMVSEALIVSTFVTAVLIYIFIQLKIVTKNYNHTFNYDHVNSLYVTNEVVNYLSEVDLETLKTELDNSPVPFLDISNCPISYIKETNYCQNLFSDIFVYRAYFVKEDIAPFIEHMEQLDVIEFNVNDLINYLKTINTKPYNNQHRLIIWFASDTFASVAF